MTRLIDLKLKDPITLSTGPVKTLRLREPVSGELRGLNLLDLMRGDVAAVSKVLPRITEPVLPEQISAQLPASVTTALWGALSALLNDEPHEDDVLPLAGPDTTEDIAANSPTAAGAEEPGSQLT